LNKVETLKLRGGTRRQTVSQRKRQKFGPEVKKFPNNVKNIVENNASLPGKFGGKIPFLL
jgi:hypothetical protein